MAHRTSCHLFPKAVSPTSGMGAAMELLRAEKVATFDDRSDKGCRICARKLVLLKTIVEPTADPHSIFSNASAAIAFGVNRRPGARLDRMRYAGPCHREALRNGLFRLRSILGRIGRMQRAQKITQGNAGVRPYPAHRLLRGLQVRAFRRDRCRPMG
jgi:hypothetical protein